MTTVNDLPVEVILLILSSLPLAYYMAFTSTSRFMLSVRHYNLVKPLDILDAELRRQLRARKDVTPEEAERAYHDLHMLMDLGWGIAGGFLTALLLGEEWEDTNDIDLFRARNVTLDDGSVDRVGERRYLRYIGEGVLDPSEDDDIRWGGAWSGPTIDILLASSRRKRDDLATANPHPPGCDRPPRSVYVPLLLTTTDNVSLYLNLVNIFPGDGHWSDDKDAEAKPVPLSQCALGICATLRHFDYPFLKSGWTRDGVHLLDLAALAGKRCVGPAQVNAILMFMYDDVSENDEAGISIAGAAKGTPEYAACARKKTLESVATTAASVHLSDRDFKRGVKYLARGFEMPVFRENLVKHCLRTVVGTPALTTIYSAERTRERDATQRSMFKGRRPY